MAGGSVTKAQLTSFSVSSFSFKNESYKQNKNVLEVENQSSFTMFFYWQVCMVYTKRMTQADLLDVWGSILR